MEKAKEKKILSIIALIIAILRLVLTWVPIINNFAAVLAIIGLILGIIAIIINRKNKKAIALISTILSILAFVVVLATQGMYSNAIDDATGKNDKNISTTKKSTTSSSENLSKKTFGLHDTVKQNDG